MALADAWLGSDPGLSKVHGIVPGGPVEWLACAAAWLTPDASAIIAGDAAATNVIASRARILDFMPFPIEPMGLMGYESRVLNALAIDHYTGKSRLNLR